MIDVAGVTTPLMNFGSASYSARHIETTVTALRADDVVAASLIFKLPIAVGAVASAGPLVNDGAVVGAPSIVHALSAVAKLELHESWWRIDGFALRVLPSKTIV